MRVLFLCSSLEPGRDGVGDYTRRLAGELIKQGHECSCLAINDRHLVNASQADEVDSHTKQNEPRVLRLSPGKSWRARTLHIQQRFDQFRPDWVSLQFVPYGFQQKGLPFLLSDRLAGMRGDFRWHIMFHELWSGEGPKVSLKARVVCLMQRFTIQRLLSRLRPRVLHTQLLLYVDRLQSLSERPKLLPLFGNIPVRHSFGSPWRKLCPEREESLRRAIKCGVFGAVHPGSLPNPVLSAIAGAAQRRGMNATFIHFGAMGRSGVETWNDAMARLPDGAGSIALGSQSAEAVSAILQHLELGLATTPASMAGKSGTVAAMREHGVPLVFGAPDPFPGYAASSGCIPATPEGVEVALQQARQSGGHSVTAVASQFIAELEAASGNSRAAKRL